MRVRNLKTKNDILDRCPNYAKNPEKLKGKWENEFKNKNQIDLEIGPGKCKFILELAKRNPNINYIAIEKSETILAIGVKNLINIPKNIRFISYDASKIEEILDREITNIYLNFSDPWPKKRHAKRRLTSSEFLKKYEKIFKNDATIIQKTDNQKLFESSLISLSYNAYKLEFVSLDLQNAQIDDNIMTEYEEKFIKKGARIYMLVAKKNKKTF